MSLWLDFCWAGEQGWLLSLPSLVILPRRRAGEARAEVLGLVFSDCAQSPSLAWGGVASPSLHLARVAGQMGVLMLITRHDATVGFSASSLKNYLHSILASFSILVGLYFGAGAQMCGLWTILGNELTRWLGRSNSGHMLGTQYRFISEGYCPVHDHSGYFIRA